jgi:hypothetical protein
MQDLALISTPGTKPISVQPGLADITLTSPHVRDQKLQDFVADSEQAFEQCIQSLSARHRQYTDDLLGFHRALHMESKAAHFAFPSALQPSPTQRLLQPSHMQIPLKRSQVEQLASTPVSIASTDDVSTAPALQESCLTEPMLKDSLFMALAPLYELKHTCGDGVARLQNAVNCLTKDVSEFKLQQKSLMPLLEVAGLFPKPRAQEIWRQTNSEMDHSRSARTGSIQIPGLTHGKSHLEFASDLLVGDDDPMTLLRSMYACETSGHDHSRALFPKYATEPKRTSRIACLLQSEEFERIVALLIVLNIVFITYSTDYAVKHPTAQANTFIHITEAIFQVCYILELGMKLAVRQHYFFIGVDWTWNWLDFALACTAAYDMIKLMRMLERARCNFASGSRAR